MCHFQSACRVEAQEKREVFKKGGKRMTRTCNLGSVISHLSYLSLEISREERIQGEGKKRGVSRQGFLRSFFPLPAVQSREEIFREGKGADIMSLPFHPKKREEI